jgi:hypothetical protein
VTSSSTHVIQKFHSFQSESRNYKNILRQNNKAFNSTKVINAIAVQQKRKLTGIDLNSREKFIINLQSKIHPMGANNRNSISFGSNTTNMCSPSGNVNVSISKVDNSSTNNTYLSNNDKKALL